MDQYLEKFHNAKNNHFFVLDCNLTFIECNESFAMFLELPKEDIIGKKFLDYIKEFFKDNFQEKFKSLSVNSFLSTAFLVNEKKLIYVDISTLKDNESGAYICSLIVKDFCQLNKEDEFKALFDNLSLGVVVHEGSGKIIMNNPASLEILGLTADQISGKSSFDPRWKTVDENLQPFQAERHPSNLAFITGKIQKDQIIGVHKPCGELRWLCVTAVPIFSLAKNKVDHVIVTMSDETEIRAIQKKQMEYLAWQKAILDNAHYAIIATNQNGIILTYNSAAEKMLEYKSSEIIGVESPSLFHDVNEIIEKSNYLAEKHNENIQPGFLTFVYEAIKYGTDTNEWTYISKSGKRFPVKLCVTTIYDANGKCIGFLGISEDLTEQKKLLNIIEHNRAQLIANSRLYSLGELAAGIAHEINNPLAVIVGKSAQLIRAHHNNVADTAKTETELIKIKLMAERISKTIKGMKLFSRNGENDRFEPKELKSIIDESLQICAEKLKDNGIEIRNYIDSNQMIECRATQISQVIINLMNNSFDAILNQPEKWIELNYKIEDDHLYLIIKDSGSGIPQSELSKIMEPFYTTRSQGQGTGIGLSISSKIAKEHFGILYVEKNTINTTFVLKIPITQNKLINKAA